MYVKTEHLFVKDTENIKYYKEALNLFKKQEYKNAYYCFDKINHNYEIYDVVLYRQALSAQRMGDYNGAIKKYRELVLEHKKSPLYKISMYNLGQLYFEKGMNSQSKNVFKYLLKNYPETDYGIAAEYYIGLLDKKYCPEKACTHFKNYIKKSPDGKFATKSIEEIVSLNRNLSEDDKLFFGISYYKNGKYKEAIKALKELPKEISWYYLAQSYIKLNEKSNARDILKIGLSKPQINKQILYEAQQLYLDTYLNKMLAINELKGIIKASNPRATDFILYKEGLLNPQKKITNANIILHKYPNGKYEKEAFWIVFYDKIKNADYKQALIMAEEYSLKYRDKDFRPENLYWCGKLSEKQRKEQKAVNYYSTLVKNYPDNYYSFRAKDRIRFIQRKRTPIGWKTYGVNYIANNTNFTSFKNAENKETSRLVENLIENEDFELLSIIDIKDDFLKSFIEYKKGNKALSTVIARNALNNENKKPDFNDKRWKLAYPIYYKDLINKYSREYHLDPYLILALIKEESHFDSNVISVTGAKGLMQVMPQTAEYIASIYGISQQPQENLFTPEYNIKIGTTYYTYLKNKLNKNDLFSVLAYNGGPNAVDFWKKKLDYNDYDEFIEQIPYPETKNYIKKVFKSYWIYKDIYNAD